MVKIIQAGDGEAKKILLYQTGKFSITSSLSKKYTMVLVEVDSNAILVDQ